MPDVARSLLMLWRMSRSYSPRARRITQPILRVPPRPRDPVVERLGFTCFRLVAEEDGFVPIELVTSTSRMFAFVR